MSSQDEIGHVVETGSDGEISSFEWRIPDFLSEADDDSYESPQFDACDGRWCLEIFPHGLWREQLLDSVSLILIRLDFGPPKTLDVTLGIRGPEGVENKRGRIQEFSKEYDNNACFWASFCSKSKLRYQECRLMPGNELIITLDFKSPSVGRGVEELQKSFQRLLACGGDCDVVIKVRGKEFRAHRMILTARSSVLQAMFSHDMVEKQSGVVTMEDFDPESFPAFLEHIYTGSTRMISNENACTLYTAADKYDFGALKEACTEFLKHNLTASCFCEAFTLAVKHDENELMNLATEFFCENSLDICKTDEWPIFLKEKSTVANELLIEAFSK